MIDFSAFDFSVFDIETGPLPDDALTAMLPEFSPPPHPGQFDPETVKYGNTKDPAKRAEKLAEVRLAHETACQQYGAMVEVLRAQHFKQFKEKAALEASTGRVVAIGLITNQGQILIDCDADEESGLREFWGFAVRWLAEQRPMVGFNTHGFDLPFLVRRSWILGVPVPAGIRSGRYWNPLFIDLMKVWTFDQRDYISLDTISAAFGVGQKIKEVAGVAVSGASFHQLWRENRPVAEEYLSRDLELPAILAQKMGVV